MLFDSDIEEIDPPIKRPIDSDSDSAATNELTAAEERQNKHTPEKDAYISNVQCNQVYCNPCKKWFPLEGSKQYNLETWELHCTSAQHIKRFVAADTDEEVDVVKSTFSQARLRSMCSEKQIKSRASVTPELESDHEEVNNKDSKEYTLKETTKAPVQPSIGPIRKEKLRKIRLTRGINKKDPNEDIILAPWKESSPKEEEHSSNKPTEHGRNEDRSSIESFFGGRLIVPAGVKRAAFFEF